MVLPAHRNNWINISKYTELKTQAAQCTDRHHFWRWSESLKTGIEPWGLGWSRQGTEAASSNSLHHTGPLWNTHDSWQNCLNGIFSDLRETASIGAGAMTARTCTWKFWLGVELHFCTSRFSAINSFRKRSSCALNLHKISWRPWLCPRAYQIFPSPRLASCYHCQPGYCSLISIYDESIHHTRLNAIM